MNYPEIKKYLNQTYENFKGDNIVYNEEKILIIIALQSFLNKIYGIIKTNNTTKTKKLCMHFIEKIKSRITFISNKIIDI
jgi:hypothetical protein